ncbi:MAG: PQQ-dependent sugar dehydrogenase [Cyclobacteriaceae bacterium]
MITLLIGCRPSGNATKPERNRFTVSTITEPNSLDEPMAFTFLNDQEMLIIERKGGLKWLNVETQYMHEVGKIAVNTIYTDKSGNSRPAEEGLIGVTAHPNLYMNNWIYLLYAHPDEPKHTLARFDFRKGFLYEETKKVVLEYPVQREECCHTGGGMTWDVQGNLYITTGNNTVNPPAGTSNLDERPGYKNSDDQRTAGNTNDLRGKILRIHPEDDGTYTIPEGNLFAPGQDKARAEIYTMGHRNPWRISIDSKTGYIYWGEVGPDARQNTERGPMGYDEFNQAKGPGFFGWPYFIGDNKPYADFDHVTDKVGELFDINSPINTSVNNTGLESLPPPQPAMIWYPYSFSDEFPLMGSAGRSATGGPVFRKQDFPISDKRFPAYFEGKWLIVEFMRGWIMSVSMDENGDFSGMEHFLEDEKFISAIDMQFGPGGDLYVLEYGSAWFQGNDNALVKRIRFNGGNREPIVKASADRKAGAVPFEVNLSSEGTIDYDEDELTFRWVITSDNGFNQSIEDPNPKLTLNQPGNYKVDLQVTDEAGNSNHQVLELLAGNEPPVVKLQIIKGNQTFFFPGQEIEYAISVEDEEDGSSAIGTIAKKDIAINFDYVPEGFDPIGIAQNHNASDEWITFSRGKTLIEESDCFSCHKTEMASIGPSYIQVAERYKNDPAGQAGLPSKIINGGVGVWGDHGMSAHPDISEGQAQQIVDYIMSLNDPFMALKEFELTGTFTPDVPQKENGKGGYLLRAAYTDKGKTSLSSLTREKIVSLRNSNVLPEENDEEKGTKFLTTPGKSFYIDEDQGYIGYKNIDLTGISGISIVSELMGEVVDGTTRIDLHTGSPDGPVIGSTGLINRPQLDYQGELKKLQTLWKKNGKKGPQPNIWYVRRMLRPRYKINIDPIDEMHDLYFVVKNPETKAGQLILNLHEIHFNQGD